MSEHLQSKYISDAAEIEAAPPPEEQAKPQRTRKTFSRGRKGHSNIATQSQIAQGIAPIISNTSPCLVRPCAFSSLKYLTQKRTKRQEASAKKEFLFFCIFSPRPRAWLWVCPRYFVDSNGEGVHSAKMHCQCGHADKYQLVNVMAIAKAFSLLGRIWCSGGQTRQVRLPDPL
jgi:hypothetical protein